MYSPAEQQSAVAPTSTNPPMIPANDPTARERRETPDGRAFTGQLAFIIAPTPLDLAIDPEFRRAIGQHQEDGITHLWQRLVLHKTGALLAHSMGLGKTLQVIVFLHSLYRAMSPGPVELRQFSANRVLTLMPGGLVANWRAEFQKWHEAIGQSPEQRKFFEQVYVAPARSHRLDVYNKWYRDGGILLLGYEAFARDLRALETGESHDLNTLLGSSESDEEQIQRAKETKRILVEGPTIVVADEAHAFRNKDGRLALAIKSIQTPFRIALSGTPLANTLDEYLALLGWLSPNDQDRIAQINTNAVPDAHQRMMRAMEIAKPITHRLGMAVAEKLLKKKTEFQIWVPLAPLQFEVYDRIIRCDSLAHPSFSPANRERLRHWLALCHHLGTLCCHPQAWRSVFYGWRSSGISDLDEFCDQYERDANRPDKANECLKSIFAGEQDVLSPAYSNKMLVLLSIIKHSKSVDDRVLVFSNYTATLDYIQYTLHRRTDFSFLRLDGSTKEQTRRRDLEHFNKGTTDVYLLSSRAAGQGINLLTAANRVVILDTTYSPLSHQQAMGRSHRLGQKKDVFVYYIITDGSIETVITRAQSKKVKLASGVLDDKWDTRETFGGKSPLRTYCAAPVETAPSPAGDVESAAAAATDPVLKMALADIELHAAVCSVSLLSGNSADTVGTADAV